MNEKFKRFLELSNKGRWEPLTDAELAEFEKMFEEFGMKDCDNCEGQGGKDFPSMTGYGWEFLKCKKCSGTGMLNIPDEIKDEIMKMNEE